MDWPGEELAWDLLADLDSARVTANAKAVFDATDAAYELTCLGQDIRICLADRTICAKSDLGMFLIDTLGEYSRLSILRYLIHACETPPSGELVNPSDLPGGGIFTKGTHVLPMKEVATCYTDRLDEFRSLGERLGGSPLDYGDASLGLPAFPRVPVVMIVWSGDDEFPPRASLLFDSSCVSQLSHDTIWSTAMMTVEMMLKEGKGRKGKE